MKAAILPPGAAPAPALQRKIDAKTKPLGALGMLESLAMQIGLIQQTLTPVLREPTVLVFAGDHGVAATGKVNPYPQAVTAQMVMNFLQGGAAINVFCRQYGIRLRVVDAGVCADFGPHEGLVDAKIRKGTRNYLDEPAMTGPELEAALAKGAFVVDESGSGNVMGFGEMGIGNSTAAALIMSALTGIPIEECIGRGTGVNDAQLQVKLQAAREALARAAGPGARADLAGPQDPDLGPLDALREFGGYEIAMMTGAMLRAAERQMVILVDGFIATSALLVAWAIAPAILHYSVFAHQSGERGHAKLLAFLGVTPLLNLGLRLGEGTGAALALPILQSAVAFLNEMASFESAGVSEATPAGNAESWTE